MQGGSVTIESIELSSNFLSSSKQSPCIIFLFYKLYPPPHLLFI